MQQMKPREKSHRVLSITRSKAKMFEFNIPEKQHITLPDDPAKLFDLTIGILGDFASPLYEILNENVDDHKQSLKFASYFFDSYLNTRLAPDYNDYLLILGAASYFLCDLPGSSSVLVKQLIRNNSNPSCGGLDNFIIWILKGNFSRRFRFPNNIYSNEVGRLAELLSNFQINGSQRHLNRHLKELRKIAIQNGSDREILLADISIALIKKRTSMSTWVCLPQYTDMGLDLWEPQIQKMDIKELWPAQKLLGENGVYRGRSAVVQMPTSAGKTKATELILRSAFLSNRASLAVIVAPYRALCAEIHSDLQKVFTDENIHVERISDSIQTDFSIEEIIKQKSIFVVTPEKLDYMLRQDPSLSDLINLLIYDEGHLFDDGSRGVKYELLLASLKTKISAESQVILISAVISNADSIKDWLLNEEGTVVTGTDLTPTYRTIAFTSWADKQLHFVSPDKPDTQVFFVPYVLKQIEFPLIGKEWKPKKFPLKNDGGDIALFLGLKLINQGSVAIFTGQKSSATKIVRRFLEINNRGYEYSPKLVSNENELSRLNTLYQINFGKNFSGTMASKFGVFAHHGDVPQGLRLSIEFALQNELIKFVICTSTLAQGVNLPLRYLIISGTRQSRELIKTRDFHNLLGRAGRAGMYTEGSIIFSNPEVWDNRSKRKYSRNSWDDVQNLLDFKNSEACVSLINNLFTPISNYLGNIQLDFNIMEFLDTYLNRNDELESYINEFIEVNESNYFLRVDILIQIRQRLNTFIAIESFLLANITSDVNIDTQTENLAKSTLSYSQLDEEHRPVLIEIFNQIASKILELETSPEKRVIYSRTFQGVNNNIELSKWVKENEEDILEISNNENFIDTFWPVFSQFITNSSLEAIPEAIARRALLDWMNGKPYVVIFEYLKDIKLGRSYITMEKTVNLCDGCFSFDGAILVGAVTQLLELEEIEDAENIITRLQYFQKSMKYGLPNEQSIIFYELGFSDRQIAQQMGALFAPNGETSKGRLIRRIKHDSEIVDDFLGDYPSYFSQKLSIIVESND